MKPCKTKWQQKWLKLSVAHPDLQRLADAAEGFCARWLKNSSEKTLLVIIGNFGSGKTHTARAIHRYCMAASVVAFEGKNWGRHKIPSVAFISWPEAASAFAEKQFGIMDDAANDDLVIIDDVGAENDPWKICADKICQILSRRERRFTVITTNIPPINWTDKFDGRINDRLLRNSVVVDVSDVPSFALR